MGHVHKPQIVPGTDKRARYCGSPIHYNKKEINFNKKCFIVDVKASGDCKIEEINLKVYKPIEVWKCSSIDEAIIKCNENKGRDCWVYLEVNTDRYIREDEIKQMKDLKKDILEIMPKVKKLEEEEIALDLSEKSFGEIFRDFYIKERETMPEEEVVELLLSIISEEGEMNETNKFED